MIHCENAQHSKEDQIRGVFGTELKNESYFSVTPTTTFTTFLLWAAGRQRACQIAECPNKHMNGKPDYFVANYSLAGTRTQTVNPCIYNDSLLSLFKVTLAFFPHTAFVVIAVRTIKS